MIQAAIFDFDGTLADSQWYWSTLIPRIYRAKGFPVSDEEYDAHPEVYHLNQDQYFSEKFGVPPVLPGMDVIRSWVEPFYRTKVQWKETTPEFLTALREKGIPLYIFSATPVPLLDTALERLNGRRYFDGVFSTREFGGEKNDPKTFLALLKKIGAAPERTVMLEDNLANILGAKGAGMATFALQDYANRCYESRLRAEADAYAIRMIDFLQDDKASKILFGD